MRLFPLIAAVLFVLSGQTASAQGAYEGRIDGEFKGWEGETVYKLQDGHIIQQASYHYHYHYAYSPAVIIYKSSHGLMIKVDGDDDDDIQIIVLK